LWKVDKLKCIIITSSFTSTTNFIKWQCLLLSLPDSFLERDKRKAVNKWRDFLLAFLPCLHALINQNDSFFTPKWQNSQFPSCTQNSIQEIWDISRKKLPPGLAVNLHSRVTCHLLLSFDNKCQDSNYKNVREKHIPMVFRLWSPIVLWVITVAVAVEPAEALDQCLGDSELLLNLHQHGCDSTCKIPTCWSDIPACWSDIPACWIDMTSTCCCICQFQTPQKNHNH
jgi:hypothetical protein